MVSFKSPVMWKLLSNLLRMTSQKKKRCQTCWPGKQSTMMTSRKIRTVGSTSIKSFMINWITTHHRTILQKRSQYRRVSTLTLTKPIFSVKHPVLLKSHLSQMVSRKIKRTRTRARPSARLQHWINHLARKLPLTAGKRLTMKGRESVSMPSSLMKTALKQSDQSKKSRKKTKEVYLQ